MTNFQKVSYVYKIVLLLFIMPTVSCKHNKLLLTFSIFILFLHGDRPSTSSSVINPYILHYDNNHISPLNYEVASLQINLNYFDIIDTHTTYKNFSFYTLHTWSCGYFNVALKPHLLQLLTEFQLISSPVFVCSMYYTFPLPSILVPSFVSLLLIWL